MMVFSSAVIAKVTSQNNWMTAFTNASRQTCIFPLLADSPKRGEERLYLQLKEQTKSWLSNKQRTLLIFVSHDDGDRRGRWQIKAGHVGSGLWLSSPPCQLALVFITIQQDLGPSEVSGFIKMLKSCWWESCFLAKDCMWTGMYEDCYYLKIFLWKD